MGQHKVHKSSNGAKYNKPRPPHERHPCPCSGQPLATFALCCRCIVFYCKTKPQSRVVNVHKLITSECCQYVCLYVCVSMCGCLFVAWSTCRSMCANSKLIAN